MWKNNTKTYQEVIKPQRIPGFTDQMAEGYVHQTLDNFFGEGGDDADSNNGDTGPTGLAYAPEPTNALRDLGVVEDGGLSGVAENVTVMPKTTLPDTAGVATFRRLVPGTYFVDDPERTAAFFGVPTGQVVEFGTEIEI